MRFSYVALSGATAIAGASLFLAVGCGDSGSTGGAGGTGSTTASTTAHTTAAATTNGATTTHATTNTTNTTATATGTATSTSTGGLVCSGNTPVTLTVKNYLAWCSVTVGNNPASTDAVQTYCVANGAATNVVTAPNTGFDLAPKPWTHTDGDSGSGDANASTTETPAATTDCIATCCPDHGLMDCPTTDQCP